MHRSYSHLRHCCTGSPFRISFSHRSHVCPRSCIVPCARPCPAPQENPSTAGTGGSLGAAAHVMHRSYSHLRHCCTGSPFRMSFSHRSHVCPPSSIVPCARPCRASHVLDILSRHQPQRFSIRHLREREKSGLVLEKITVAGRLVGPASLTTRRLGNFSKAGRWPSPERETPRLQGALSDLRFGGARMHRATNLADRHALSGHVFSMRVL